MNLNLFLVFLSLLGLALGQLVSLSKAEGTNIYLFDILILFTSLVNVIYLFLLAKKFYIPKAIFYLFGFLLTGLFSLCLNFDRYTSGQLISSGFYLVRLFFYVLFALGVFNLVRNSEGNTEQKLQLGPKVTLNQIYKIVTFLGLLVSVLGFIQLVILPDFTTLDPSLGWDPHKNRLASTFFDPNFVGAYLVVILSMFLFKFSNSKFFINNKLKVFISVILLSAIFLTFSRSAWLMLSVIIFVYGVLKSPKILVLSAVVALLAYYSVPRIQTRLSGTTDPADSAHFRLISWANTFEIVKDNPIFGVGYNGLRTIQQQYGFVDYDSLASHSASGSDSSLLFVLATTGFIGAIVFIIAILQPYLMKNPNAFVYKIVMLGLLVESQFVNSMFYPQILILWLLLLCFSYL